MEYQLEFWPQMENAPHEQGQWINLSIEEQAEGTALLARLIANTVCPHLIDATEENRDDQ